ncbi:MFS transporter [Chamaesiphon sp. VAR_48_metabat_135_sub]|uniref:MFS transporter n=1 Tax=Chamaesiphon sp. VAR_48_metabat_135_sub TaxID=2964699 RepID=UPI00286B7C00|nr:MFS transporter [Chamaesiphon sp. VAR_48_metabat_135_sub]
MNTADRSAANQNLFLATMAFAVAFANWGIISGLAPLLRKELGLSVTQASVMIAIPVLLGSVGRIPLGLLTDRYGGRIVFSILLAFTIVPAVALSLNHSYPSLLFWGFWMGLAGTSFAVGVAFVSGWFPPSQQGTTLGIYGAGNIGQSVAVFGGPVLAANIGIPATFLVFSAVAVVWGGIFALTANNAKPPSKSKSLAENIAVLKTEKLSWVLSIFYALTFGGFVALSIYLPTLYKEVFALAPADAGARTAFFVLVATLSRPVGGILSDKIGGQKLLVGVFLGIAAISWLMAMPSIVLFTIGSIGCAVLFGLGNGGVFKLVPQYFPQQTGSVTGLVGAAGGLGGFFPPIVLGICRDVTGSYAMGFGLLIIFALTCTAILSQTFLKSPARIS